MQIHSDIDLVIAGDLQREAQSLARSIRDARIARGPATLATTGPRANAARWMSRALLRAEPCPQRSSRNAV